MSAETTQALIVGAGQAGLAMSEHLSARGISHIVLERDRIAERWRTGRWDSLVANGPAWHDRFPGMDFAHTGPDGFAPKEQVADYFEAYAARLAAPVRCGVEVRAVTRRSGQPGFHAETSAGVIEADYVIAATGAFQTPVFPPLIPDSTGITQMHSAAYRNPDALASGAVLVIGAGSSGVQIAQELQEAGRKVYLSVGAHDRPPRRYRGRDFVWWLGVLNKWDAEARPRDRHTTIAVSGANGGQTIDFRKLAAAGMTLLGRAEGFAEGALQLAADLGDKIARGDAYYLALLAEADAYAARNGLNLPQDPDAHIIGPDPDCVRDPLRSLDLAAAGISTVIWATGYSADYSWLKLDACDATGRPLHRRGIASEPGLYFLGLPWQTRRGSSFIWGVWYDAKYIADHIAKQRDYRAYTPTP